MFSPFITKEETDKIFSTTSFSSKRDAYLDALQHDTSTLVLVYSGIYSDIDIHVLEDTIKILAPHHKIAVCVAEKENLPRLSNIPVIDFIDLLKLDYRFGAVAMDIEALDYVEQSTARAKAAHPRCRVPTSPTEPFPYSNIIFLNSLEEAIPQEEDSDGEENNKT